MAISLFGGTSGTAINSGAITLTLPGSMLAGDLIIVSHGLSDGTDLAMPAMTTAGYTNVGASELLGNGSANKANSKTWYKYHVADTTAVCAAGGGGTDSAATAVLMVLRGVASAAQGGPFSTAPVTASGTGLLANPPSIATAAGDAVVIMGSGATGTIGAVTLPTNYTTTPKTATLVETIDGAMGMGCNLAPGNPEDPGNVTFAAGAGSATDGWTAISMAIEAAPDGVIPHISMARSAN
jgi:hypothetical protein